MPKRLSKVKELWLGHCGWCLEPIAEEGERFSLHGKFRDQTEYRKNAGKIVSFEFADAERTVAAYVVTRDAPAAKEGKEVIFQVCSQRCRLELSDAMKEVKQLN